MNDSQHRLLFFIVGRARSRNTKVYFGSRSRNTKVYFGSRDRCQPYYTNPRSTSDILQPATRYLSETHRLKARARSVHMADLRPAPLSNISCGLIKHALYHADNPGPFEELLLRLGLSSYAEGYRRAWILMQTRPSQTTLERAHLIGESRYDEHFSYWLDWCTYFDFFG